MRSFSTNDACVQCWRRFSAWRQQYRFRIHINSLIVTPSTQAGGPFTNGNVASRCHRRIHIHFHLAPHHHKRIVRRGFVAKAIKQILENSSSPTLPFMYTYTYCGQVGTCAHSYGFKAQRQYQEALTPLRSIRIPSILISSHPIFNFRCRKLNAHAYIRCIFRLAALLLCISGPISSKTARSDFYL